VTPRLLCELMNGSGGRPVLLVDVDGVLSLFGFGAAPPAGLVPASIDGIPQFLSPDAALRLNRLAATFQCAWCTGWEERAEEHLPRLLGLPGGWPHLTFAPREPVAGRHWKLGAIESWAGRDAPLAWIDDAFDPSCDAWATARDAPTLLVRTEPATGLAQEHVTRLESWARSL
jgi:hypothetical protein